MKDPRVSEPLAPTQFKDKKPRSERVATRGRRAVDEGRDKKATRLLKKAARIEDREIGRYKYKIKKY